LNAGGGGRRRRHTSPALNPPTLPKPYCPLSRGRREGERGGDIGTRSRVRGEDKVVCAWVSACGVLNACMPNPKLLPWIFVYNNLWPTVSANKSQNLR
jgi:hypothetical protein